MVIQAAESEIRAGFDWRPAASFLAALTLAAYFLIGGAAAHDDVHGKSHFKGTRASPTAVMRALAADSHAAQTEPALASTPCNGGFAGIYPCHGVDLLAYLPVEDIGGSGPQTRANDIWGWTDVKRLSILTPDRRAKLTPLSGTAEVVPVVHRGDPRGFV